MNDSPKTMNTCVESEECWRGRVLAILQNSEKNFEAMDGAMRTAGVPIAVAQAAFESGLRYLREAKAMFVQTEISPERN